MNLINREEIVRSLESYIHDNPSAVVMAGTTGDKEESFLDVLDTIKTTVPGIGCRTGLTGFIAVTANDLAELESTLKECCVGNWRYVVTLASNYPTVEDAIRETEWRSQKWINDASKPCIAII